MSRAYILDLAFQHPRNMLLFFRILIIFSITLTRQQLVSTTCHVFGDPELTRSRVNMMNMGLSNNGSLQHKTTYFSGLGSPGSAPKDVTGGYNGTMNVKCIYIPDILGRIDLGDFWIRIQKKPGILPALVPQSETSRAFHLIFATLQMYRSLVNYPNYVFSRIARYRRNEAFRILISKNLGNILMKNIHSLASFGYGQLSKVAGNVSTFNCHIRNHPEEFLDLTRKCNNGILNSSPLRDHDPKHIRSVPYASMSLEKSGGMDGSEAQDATIKKKTLGSTARGDLALQIIPKGHRAATSMISSRNSGVRGVSAQSQVAKILEMQGDSKLQPINNNREVFGSIIHPNTPQSIRFRDEPNPIGIQSRSKREIEDLVDYQKAESPAKILLVTVARNEENPLRSTESGLTENPMKSLGSKKYVDYLISLIRENKKVGSLNLKNYIDSKVPESKERYIYKFNKNEHLLVDPIDEYMTKLGNIVQNICNDIVKKISNDLEEIKDPQGFFLTHHMKDKLLSMYKTTVGLFLDSMEKRNRKLALSLKSKLFTAYWRILNELPIFFRGQGHFLRENSGNMLNFVHVIESGLSDILATTFLEMKAPLPGLLNTKMVDFYGLHYYAFLANHFTIENAKELGTCFEKHLIEGKKRLSKAKSDIKDDIHTHINSLKLEMRSRLFATIHRDFREGISDFMKDACFLIGNI